MERLNVPRVISLSESWKALVITFTLLIALTVVVNVVGHPLTVMIVVEAHSDDLDLSLSGIALQVQKAGGQIIVIELTDCAADNASYIFALSKGYIKPDAIINGTVTAPNDETYTRAWYSENLGVLRIDNMTARYKLFGFSLIRPDTVMPDAVWEAPQSVQNAYIAAARQEVTDKLNQQLNLLLAEYKQYSIQFYCHDPKVMEHGDHAIAGQIGDSVFLNITIPLKAEKYYYAYTNVPLRQDYVRVDISSVLVQKMALYNSVYEFADPNLHSAIEAWAKDPYGNNYYFVHEIFKVAVK